MGWHMEVGATFNQEWSTFRGIVKSDSKRLGAWVGMWKSGLLSTKNGPPLGYIEVRFEKIRSLPGSPWVGTWKSGLL